MGNAGCMMVVMRENVVASGKNKCRETSASDTHSGRGEDLSLQSGGLQLVGDSIEGLLVLQVYDTEGADDDVQQVAQACLPQRSK